MSLKIIRNIILGLACLILAFIAGVNFGQNKAIIPAAAPEVKISSSNPPVAINVDFRLFWDVWDRLNRLYIDKKALDAKKMLYGAISGMVASLQDPYTVFLPPDQNKDAKDDLSGKFEGIGAQLGVKDKKIVVIAPLKDAPAEKAGIKAGDLILKVDGKDTTGWTIFEAVSKIRGPKGTTVNLTIMHKDASVSAEVVVNREAIKVASVEWEIKNVRCSFDKTQDKQMSSVRCQIIKDACSDCIKVVYLKLSRFGDNTNDEWNKAIDEIDNAFELPENQEIKGLVFDLRNNPGGYLSGSVFIASEFLKDGIVVIQEEANGVKKNFSVNRKGRLLNIPLVVLINKGTASAGEIVAGALSVRNRSKLVGETSFGKGSIQEAQELSDGAGIHITVAKWLLPDGKWINGTGVTPEIKVENDETKPDEDLQFEKAIEVLVK